MCGLDRSKDSEGVSYVDIKKTILVEGIVKCKCPKG